VAVLCALIASANSDGEFVGEEVLDWLEECRLRHAISPREEGFLFNSTEKERSDMTWRTEAAGVLAWCLSWTPMPGMDEQVDGTWLGENVLNGDVRRMIEHARLRSEPEIHAAFDLVLRVHWAIVHHRINNLPPLPGVDADIIYERHYAFNWVIDPEIAWDDVTTDT
jgi:hypothetical protein